MTDAILAAHFHVVSRSIAKQIGQHVYYSGSECKNGHDSWRSTGSSNCLICLKAYRSDPANKAKHRQYQARRMQDPAIKEREAAARRLRYHENRDAHLADMRRRNPDYYRRNKEQIKAKVRLYQKENAVSRREYANQWQRNKLKSDPAYAAAATMRKLVSRVCERLQAGRRQMGRTTAVLGYTPEEFRQHIERQFLPGMSWEGRADWHIDHIIPLASFDLTDPEERRAANSLANLRPIWAADNMSKSNKITNLL